MGFRLFQVTVPEARLKDLMRFLEKKRQIFGIPQGGITKVHTASSFLVTFRVSRDISVDVLQALLRAGPGRKYGIVDILPVDVTKPKPPEMGGRAATRRLTNEEVYDVVSGGNQLNSDSLTMLLVASIIAGIGLVQNSSTTVVASMLVSPLMGPILGITLGPVVGDWKMFLTGVWNELVMLCLGVTTGAVIGIIALVLMLTLEIPTLEMSSRGEPLNLLLGAGVASASGVGVALSVTLGGINSLVGVAISASLLPPVVNAGLCTVVGIFGPLLYADRDYPGTLYIGIISFLLALINIACIFVFGVLMFKIKSLGRISVVSHKWRWRDLVSSAPISDNPRTSSKDTYAPLTDIISDLSTNDNFPLIQEYLDENDSFDEKLASKKAKINQEKEDDINWGPLFDNNTTDSE